MSGDENGFNFDMAPRAIAAGEAPPTMAEMEVFINAIRTAASACGELQPIQHTVLDAVCESYVGQALDVPQRIVGPEELAETVTGRTPQFRQVLHQRMALVALVAEELPKEVAAAVGFYSVALGLKDKTSMLEWYERCKDDSYDGLLLDFTRNGYSGGFMERSRPVLRTEADLGDGWAAVEDDESLAIQWDGLEGCPHGSIGRTVFDFYRSRGFAFPGRPGSAPPLLAQHDWVHVLADYGTTLENEIEVFALISAADTNPQSFSLLAMVVGLFGTGRVPTAAGLFEADGGHLDEPVSVRLAEALYRGGRINPEGGLPTAMLEVDWFELADQPLPDVRQMFGLEPKRDRAVNAGSVGPWEEAGFSAYQRQHGDLSIMERYS